MSTTEISRVKKNESLSLNLESPHKNSVKRDNQRNI